MKILDRYTGKTIYENDNAANFRELVELAVKEGVSLKFADFTNADLTGANFRNAYFASANFRNACFAGANFRDANFRDANFRDANFAGTNFTCANLIYANLTGVYFRGANLRNANLTCANFTGANLTKSDLTGAKLQNAVFKNANINGTKFDFKIPKIEDIHEKIYKAASGEDALNMDEWHTCATTHCIAGWAVVLAGEEGAELEKKVSTKTAATLIYLKSDKKGRVPDFHNTNEEALKQLKELAESE